MKLGIIIYSTDAETVWNAFRLGVFALKEGDTVNVFLLANGVECESLDTDQFPVTTQMKDLVERGGKILACAPASRCAARKARNYAPFRP